MDEKDNGGRAFPSEQGADHHGQWNQTFDPGMSLRDYFAAAALAGMGWVSATPEAEASKARAAYRIADAMLAARTGEGE